MRNKKNSKKGSRSRRKTASKTRGTVMSVDPDNSTPSVQLQLPIAEILSGVQESVEQLSIDAGLLVMKALIEDEVERRAGPKGKHDPERCARRYPSFDRRHTKSRSKPGNSIFRGTFCALADSVHYTSLIARRPHPVRSQE